MEALSLHTEIASFANTEFILLRIIGFLNITQFELRPNVRSSRKECKKELNIIYIAKIMARKLSHRSFTLTHSEYYCLNFKSHFIFEDEIIILLQQIIQSWKVTR